MLCFSNCSCVFLAFSSFEGLALQPIEAALAGNYVIGYTGEGGKEYWKRPIFTEVNSGNINGFVKSINKKIIFLKKNKKFPKKNLINLENKFSSETETKNIIKFLKFIPK